jgi:hypothetical protein
MTEEQQRIAIAEACGWTNIHPCDVKRLDGTTRHIGYWGTPNQPSTTQPWLPDYLNDRNAIHAAILSVFASNPGYHERWFTTMVSSVVYDDGQKPFRECTPDGLRDICACIMADTPKLAEALLRTIGKWVES